MLGAVRSSRERIEPPRGSANRLRFLHALVAGLVALAALQPEPAVAQQGRPDRYVPPLRADETVLALTWIQGLWSMPVTCKLEDGSTIDLQESISIRSAPQRGTNAFKAVFFGIDVQRAQRCFNLVSSDLLDRRGVVFFTYRSSNRSDFGMRDFRVALQSGELEYHVSQGRLQYRRIGPPPAPPEDAIPGAEDSEQDSAGSAPSPVQVHTLEEGSIFRVRLLSARSDGARLLSHGQTPNPNAPPPRDLEFLIQSDDSTVFQGFYRESTRKGSAAR